MILELEYSDFEEMVHQELTSVFKLLSEKNKAYGNSALDPKRIFSSSSSVEQIKVRIDDKLSRIKNATENGLDDNEDAELDLIGYLVLLRIAKKGQ